MCSKPKQALARLGSGRHPEGSRRLRNLVGRFRAPAPRPTTRTDQDTVISTPADGGAALVRLGSAAYCYNCALAALGQRLPVAGDSAAPGSGEAPRFGTENGKPSERGAASTRIRGGACPHRSASSRLIRPWRGYPGRPRGSLTEPGRNTRPSSADRFARHTRYSHVRAGSPSRWNRPGPQTRHCSRNGARSEYTKLCEE